MPSRQPVDPKSFLCQCGCRTCMYTGNNVDHPGGHTFASICIPHPHLPSPVSILISVSICTVYSAVLVQTPPFQLDRYRRYYASHCAETHGVPEGLARSHLGNYWQRLGQPCTVNRPYGGLCSQRPVTPDQQLPLPPPSPTVHHFLSAQAPQSGVATPCARRIL